MSVCGGGGRVRGEATVLVERSCSNGRVLNPSFTRYEQTRNILQT